MASFNATHGLELIDQRSFAKPDRFKLHPFIFVLLRRGRRPRLVRTTLWTCFVFFVHLRHRPKTKPPRTSLSQASVSPPQIVASVSDHRTISVSSFSADFVMLGFKPRCRSHPPVSVSLRKRFRNNGDFLCIATQALKPLDILELVPIFPSIQIASRIVHILSDSIFQALKESSKWSSES